MLAKTIETAAFCLQPASIVDDGDGNIEVRIADGLMCPYCKVKIKNYPEETPDGWRLLCLSCHQEIITADRRSYHEDILTAAEDPL